MFPLPPKTPRRSRLFPDLHKSKTMYQPGMVEIKLKEDIRPEVLEHGGKGRPRLTSRNRVNLEQLHQTLDRVRAHRIEHALPISYEKADELVDEARKHGRHTEHLAHVLRVHVPLNAPVEKIAQEFSKLPQVERASPLRQHKTCANPNDPLLGADGTLKTDDNGMEDQWYIFRCNANKAWDKNITGKTTAVVVVDEGFLSTHEDLQPKVKQTYNAVPAIFPPINATAPLDSDSSVVTLTHGTGTAGLAAAAGNHGIGMT